MIRRVGEGGGVVGRGENNLFLLPIEEVGRRRVRVIGLVKHDQQQRLGFGAVVKNPFTGLPTMRGEEQGHGEPLLAVGRGTGVDLLAVEGALPSEVALSRTARMIHVRLGPFPQAIELVLVIQLHGDHHPVRHALGAHVGFSDIGDVGQVVSNRIIHALVAFPAEEKLVPRGFDFGADRLVGFSQEFAE